MSYDYDLILKEGFSNSYSLVTKSGRVLYQCRSSNLYNAMLEARAYMSSWNSVRIRTEEEYEQDEKRDRVSESTATTDAAAGSDSSVSQARKPD